MTEDNLNQLGMPALTHWLEEKCDMVAPGDCTTDQVKDVDCPGCLRLFQRIKERRIAAKTKSQFYFP